MVSKLARWLVHRRYYKMAGWMLTAASAVAGKNNRIAYNKEGYWSHRQNGWVINDAFPNIRLDIAKLNQFNESVYFHQYKPGPDDIIVDLGAGIGTESIFLSRIVGTNGRIYAIEASPMTYSILQANAASNSLTNLFCFNIAIADKRGKLSIGADTDNHIANSVFEGSGTEIEAFTMDEFLAGHNITRVDFLKVNIEGAEKLLIQAFTAIDRVRHVAISCHDFLGNRTGNAVFFTKSAVKAFLIEHNFEISSRQTGVDYEDDWIYGYNKTLLTNAK